MVLAYNEIITTNLRNYLRNSAALGSQVHTQAKMVETLFQLQRQFLLSSCRGTMPNAGSGPSQAEFITKIQKYAMDHKQSSYRKHLDYIASTITALGWVVIQKNPAEVFNLTSGI